MPETTPNDRIECQTCRGSGMLDDGPCFACNGKGWFEPGDAEEHDLELDLSILDEEPAEGDAPDTVSKQGSAFDTGLDVLDGGGDSGSVLDGTAAFAGIPGSGKIEPQDRAPLDSETELEELREHQERIKERIGVLESVVASGPAGPKQSKAGQRDYRERQLAATTDELLALLEESQLLEPKQLRAAQLMATDATLFAKRLLGARFLTEWQMDQLLGGRTSFLLGKNKLIRLIGVGSAGVVLLARHITMDRQVAVKILSRKLSQNLAVLNRFLSQARTVAELDHPNIIRAYNVDKADDRYYLVMEYVQGPDLEKIVAAKGPLRFAVAADFVAQAAAGLHHGHLNNIVHEDVRPSNLLLDSDGTIKIDYLALTRIHEGESGAPVSGANNKIVNSIDCLAPECTGGDIFRPTADIYALGCTLYFLLTGKPPFPGGAPAQKLQKHEREQPPSISSSFDHLFCAQKLQKHQREQPESIRTFRSDVPEPLVELCNKMMAKKPDDRYPTCQAVAEALLPFAGRKADSG